MFKLNMATPQGEIVVFDYDPYAGTLTDHEGKPLIVDDKPGRIWRDAPVVSPEEPGRKGNPKMLKIQLGLKCNYGCKYCSQTTFIDGAVVTDNTDAIEFVQGMDGWITEPPERIEFWGGEPFVYWKKLLKLVPLLREKFPQVQFSVVTNGSLLDDEKVDWLLEHSFGVGFSHDGPGQPLRDAVDPLDDPISGAAIRRLMAESKEGHFSINVVLTHMNRDVIATRQWFVDKLGTEDFNLTFEGIVASYDDVARNGAASWAPEDYEVMKRSIIEMMVTSTNWRHYGSITEKFKDFISSIEASRPARVLGQKCGMDRADVLAVDLKGNVMTCQNVGADDPKHNLGHVSDMGAVRLDTAWHWSKRGPCGSCPVVQLCKGSCMFIEGEDFAQSCDNEFHFNTAILTGILYQMTGLIMVSIDGNIRPRPPRKKVIPISVSN